MRFLHQIIWTLLALIKLDAPVDLFLPQRHSALLTEGWDKSYRKKEAINKTGQPIPWCTYPFIKFIEPRLNSSFRVFEYGCGNSTLWYAQRVKEIVAVEHDAQWLDRIKVILPTNCRVFLKDLNNDYVSEIYRHGLFDIVIIDGRRRIECTRAALQALKPHGIIVWDNLDMPKYFEVTKFLMDNDFKEINFDGMGPINTYAWRTSIFYRRDNCLGI